MARPREFDIDEALSQAMVVFWEQGYRSCSLDNLIEAMSVSRQSIYCAFGDKHSIFLKVLELYRKENLTAIGEMLKEQGSPITVLHSFLSYAITPADERNCPEGCLVMNTALEFGTSDSAVTAEIQKMLSGMERLLVQIVARGQSVGEISIRTDASSVARILLNSLCGIRVLQKAGTSQKELKNIANALMLILAA